MYAGKSQPVPIPSVGDHGKLLIQKNGGSSIGFVGKQGTGRQRYSRRLRSLLGISLLLRFGASAEKPALLHQGSFHKPHLTPFSTLQRRPSRVRRAATRP